MTKKYRRLTALVWALNLVLALSIAAVIYHGSQLMPEWYTSPWVPATDTECETWERAYLIGGDETPAWIARISRDFHAR